MYIQYKTQNKYDHCLGWYPLSVWVDIKFSTVSFNDCAAAPMQMGVEPIQLLVSITSADAKIQKKLFD